MKSGEINSLFKNLSKVIKNPKTDLTYKNKFTLLVSVVLSAQCTDKRVNIITPSLFEAFPTPEVMAEASDDYNFDIIKSCSYPRKKARQILGKLHWKLIHLKKKKI